MNLPKTAFPFLLHFIRRQSLSFFILIVTAIIWAANDIFFPYFLKLIVNRLQNFHGDPHKIFSVLSDVLIVLVLFWLVAEIFQRIQGIVQIYTFPQFRANIRIAVFDYVKSHSQEYFSNHFAGNIAKKISDLPTSCHATLEMLCFNFVPATTGVIIALVMMWETKPIFAIVLLIWLFLHFGLTALFLFFGNVAWEVHAEAVSTLSGKVIDALTNIFSIRLFARGKYEMQYLKRFQAAEMGKAKRAMWLMEVTRIGLGISGLAFIFGMIFFLLYGWSYQWVTLGDFTQIGMQSSWILAWIWFVSFQLTVFARELGTINNALNLVVQEQEVVDANDALPLRISRGEICFDRVTFAYRKNNLVFQDLSVTIHPGQKVGLVGFSGSGKTTFVNLILRFYDLTSGRILIDGQTIAKITQDSLREQIAMIPQDPTLFHRSLIENIRYGRLNATDEEVIEASKLAHCHEFIEVLDEGYHSLVGDRGIKLSGGQRQRIAIARAVLKNAPILILDEATSSLDSVTEKLIQDSLRHLMHNRTTLVIAHRLSTLGDMDRILVFHKGKVIEDGTKDELLTANGHFAKLWSMQMHGFLPDDSLEKEGIEEELGP